MLCRLPTYYSIAADVSYMYESSHYYGTMLYGSVWELFAGVQKKLLEERLSVKLSATDFFWSHKYVGKGIFGDTVTIDRFAWDNRVVQVSVSYSFAPTTLCFALLLKLRPCCPEKSVARCR